MNKIVKLIMIWAIAMMAIPANAQRRISGNVADDIDVIIGANVVEKDKNNRIVSQTVTDFNGNFTMTIKSNDNRLEVTYIGYKPFISKLAGKSVFKIVLEDNTKIMKTLEVVGKKSAPTTGLDIPAREFAGAVQKFNMDDMEGLAFESVDQALQGQIAGLDIIANSGNLGSGTQMRLRGVSTINGGNSNPLIVVDDHIFELPDDAQQIDFASDNYEEQFSTLLSVNPEDIESITVLKDAASAAKWGAKASNGVIEIKIRRGRRGPASINFSYKFTGTWQPKGYTMLNGDEYTMYMKESYYNPFHTTTDIPELDYRDETPIIKRNFSSNTDWIDEVTQLGKEHKWYVNISGGGEKATFRISAGYDKSDGSVIAQKLDRFTTTTALDYWVSDRIKFSSNIKYSNTSNHKNYGNDIMGRAYNAMPNMSVYYVDEDGPTDKYFTMMPIGASGAKNNGYNTSYALRDMYGNGNPVARAYMAYWLQKQNSLTPQFSIEYKLLGKDDDKWRLNYVGDVQLDIYNTTDNKYCPASLTNMEWYMNGDQSNPITGGKNDRNVVSNSEYKSLQFSTRHDLRFYSAFKNKDFNLSGLGRFEMYSGNSNSQSGSYWNVPTGITNPAATGIPLSASASNGEWRSHSFFFQTHFSYKSVYSLDASLRIDGSTNFGSGSKYGLFPAVGGRWNISDEKWMGWSKKWLSTFSIRPTWGITGNSNIGSFNQYNKYASSGFYNGHTVIVPENLSLSKIRWERQSQWNIGFNMGFLDDMLNVEFEIYDKTTTDLIMYNQRIPSANGYSSIGTVNAGTLNNRGWELNFSTGKFAKVGKFSMKINANISQNFNKLEEMNSLLLESMNGSDNQQPGNMHYIGRIGVGSALGSIYGLHNKGVYRYDYDHSGYTQESFNAYGRNEVDAYGQLITYGTQHTGTGYDINHNPINTASAAARRGENSTCPIAYDAKGNMMTNEKGEPLKMYYVYNNDNATRYEFRGGDVIYEDVNHDGQIDRYDVTYLGNSNPTCNGGFGLTFDYDRFSLKFGFSFRMGNQIINLARMNYESMQNNNNQSYATTWRWRKNGDITEIPRAINTAGVNGARSYNSLPSDRYVEDGDFLRCNFIQFSYSFDPKAQWMKTCGIKNLKLFASINNPWVWTKYTGVDPEVSCGAFGIATDNSRTPRSRSFTCSLNLGF